MKFKVMAIVFATLITQLAFAGYDCQSSKGDRVQVVSYFRKGEGAKVQSQQISAYYKQHQKIWIKSFSSIVDPSTGKFATENQKNGYLFALQADASIHNIFSLELQFKSSVKAKGIFRGMSGEEFEMDLTCTQTPNLESIGG